jgi:hypothetical protein
MSKTRHFILFFLKFGRKFAGTPFRYLDEGATVPRIMSRHITHNIPIASSSGATGIGMSGTLFERCAVEGDGDQSMMLQCVADAVESSTASASSDLDQWLLVLAGAMVFFMQVRS